MFDRISISCQRLFKGTYREKVKKMIEALEDLRNNQILYNQNVIDLKECIRQNYPHYTAKHATDLFASAIHKIIDKNITHFDKDIQKHIKNHLLQQVVQKDIFAINAYDIFEACTALEVSDDHYFENLTDWLNNSQSACFSKDEVFKLVVKLRAHEEVLISLLPSQPIGPINDSEIHAFNFLDIFKKRNAAIFIACAVTISSFALFQMLYHKNISQEKRSTSLVESPLSVKENASSANTSLLINEMESDIFLQKQLQYKEIDEMALYNWLTERNSILAEQPYFSSIINVAKEFNINPLFMFAITGQEQSFVPKSNPKAFSIANNPFNVYGSWEEFNTDINDTSRIAARTILNLSKDCPKDADPIQWINKKYAEDPNWHLGVTQIFAELEETAGN